MDSSSSTPTAPLKSTKRSERKRSPLSSRLQSLVDDDAAAGKSQQLESKADSPHPSSSACSTDHDLTSSFSSSPDGMWRAQRMSHSKMRSSSSVVSRTKLQNGMLHPRVHSPVAPLSSPDQLNATSAFEFPVLRWFGKPSSIKRTSSPQSSDSEPSSSSSSKSSSPRSPPSALREAFDDDIRLCSSPTSSDTHAPDTLQHPPTACFSSSLAGMYGQGPGRISVRRSPPFLDSLARSTLPTSSVTIPEAIFRHPTDQFHPNDQPYSSPTASPSRQRRFGPRSQPIRQVPPSRTSIDSLRHLRDCGTMTNGNVSSSPNNRSFTSLPNKWWFGEHKESVDNLLDESDQADTAEGEAAKIRKRYHTPNNPVVFCHGLMGFDSLKIGPSIAPMEVSHWRGIKEVLEANGTEVHIARVPATSSPAERAKVLEASVSEKYPGRSVHLIGHSMGGLDCRYLTTHLKHRKFNVLSITTIATPHRGSSFADHFISTIGKDRIPSFMAMIAFLPDPIGGGDGKAFESLTLESMRMFNEETPDVDGVQYYSWGATFEPGLIDTFKWPHSVILENEGPNDGLVSVESAKWGTYLGTLEDVNHLDLVGWINSARYKWAEFTGREIKFKPATFYLGVADHLARQVEGQDKDVKHGTEDIRAAEETHAGEGVKTTEGVENKGPSSSPSPKAGSDETP